jgi:hypothetical protein
MKMDIKLGSIVYGKGGVGNPVTAIDGEMLAIDTAKGLRLVNISKILRVEQPPTANTSIPPRPSAFKLGDRVTYLGSDLNLKKQYAGSLEVWKISKNPYDGYTCLKPNGRATSWVQFEDLELVNAIEVTPSMTGLEGDLWV